MTALIPLKGISRKRAEALAQMVGRSYGMNIDITTEVGQDNRLAILTVIEADLRLHQAQRGLGMSADNARALHAANMAALEAHLREAGLTAAEIETLVHKYRNVPDDPA